MAIALAVGVWYPSAMTTFYCTYHNGQRVQVGETFAQALFFTERAYEGTEQTWDIVIVDSDNPVGPWPVMASSADTTWDRIGMLV